MEPPDTRRKLLEELTERGFDKAQLQEFHKILSAENSDLYDVFAYVASYPNILDCSIPAKVHFTGYEPKQQEFQNFVLQQNVKEGVEELDDTKISDLLILKNHAIADAKKELGNIAHIRNTFIGFQGYLFGS